MTYSFPIAFQARRVQRNVTVALAPVDRFTGVPVRDGVKAWLWDVARREKLPYRAIRNLSGQLVFLDLPVQLAYDFLVDASEAGYFGDQTVHFVPAAANDPRPANDRVRQVVWLQRRPDSAFDEGTTLVRGMVARGAVPAGDVRVSVVPPVPDDPTFLTSSDGRGVFALALRLPPPPAGEVPVPVLTTIRLEKAGAPARDLIRPLTDGRTHVFLEAIDLDGVNEPIFGP
jgi:hypothetical protein